MPELYEREDLKENTKEKIEKSLADKLSARAARQYIGTIQNGEARVKGRRSGMAYLGAAGWYIPVPTVLGAFLGQWLDKTYPYKTVSWSLNCLLLGLAVGMLNMWFWLKREGIERTEEEQEERNRVLQQVKEELLQKELSENAVRKEAGE